MKCRSTAAVNTPLIWIKPRELQDMQKVYQKLGLTAFGSIALFSVFFFYPPLKLITVGITIFLILIGLWILFSPLFSYDEKNLEIRSVFLKRKSINSWVEVKKVLLIHTFPVKQYCVAIDKSHVLFFGQNVKNYKRVLSDIVRYVQKNNSGAEIDPRVLKELEKI